MLDSISSRDAQPVSLLRPTAIPTHSGLDDVDPWAPVSRRATARALWPWGLAQVSETLEVVALAIIMFIAVRAVAQNFIVDGASMLPTFQNGELLIVNRLAYRTFDLSWLPGVDETAWRPFGQPTIGDVIVFKFPRNPERDFIKRVIALPGQSVAIRDGLVLVDGQPLAEGYVLDAPTYTFGPEVVPAGQVFVLGDNRNNSYDSHSWGMLETELIIGRADVRYWPFARIGLIGNRRPAAPTPNASSGAVVPTAAQPGAVPSR